MSNAEYIIAYYIFNKYISLTLSNELHRALKYEAQWQLDEWEDVTFHNEEECESYEDHSNLPSHQICLEDFICEQQTRKCKKPAVSRTRKLHQPDANVSRQDHSTNNVVQRVTSLLEDEDKVKVKVKPTSRKPTCFVDSRYKDLELEFQKIDPAGGIHFSRLGGEGLRASTRLVCNSSRVAFLLLWSVHVGPAVPSPDIGSAKRILFNFQAVPIVNSSEFDNAYLLHTAQSLGRELGEQFREELDDTLNQEDLFCELTRMVIRKKSEMQHVFSSTLGSARSHRQAARLKRAFEKPSVDIQLASSHVDLYQGADVIDRMLSREGEEKRTSIVSSSNETYSNNCCMVCFDEFDSNELYVEACNHRACTSCWR